MLKRNIKVTFRLDKKESDHLRKRVKKSGLSQEAYLRQLINGLAPRDKPPPDYFSMMRELYAVGDALEIMAKAEDAARVSRILERLEVRDLGSGSCEPAKTKAEVKAEKREAAKEAKAEKKAENKAAKQKQRTGVRKARQQFSEQRKILRKQYKKEVGRGPKLPHVKVKRAPKSRIGQLLQELGGEVAQHTPVVGAIVRRREKATAHAEPEQADPLPDLMEEPIPPPVREGQAASLAPAAVQPEARAQNPPARTERTTREKAPSAPSSPTNSKEGATVSSAASAPESVKVFLAEETARQRGQKPPPEKQPKQQGKAQKSKQPQRKTKSKKERS